ncbi:MAG: DNA-binding protein [Clostridia bacterium]|nr:DNA-binding protein [Clostridia bacterium]
MRAHVKRLHRGDDILLALSELAREHDIRAGAVVCAVGCVLRARIRDASGVTVHELDEHMEIVSMTGTISRQRSHVHIALAGEDMAVIGGHMLEGCIVNTTCELAVLELEGWSIGEEYDTDTGYGEARFTFQTAAGGERH